MELLPYRREAAEAYARYWAYGRNPDFYDYEAIGGDCTNFASQCIYAGTGVMNFTPTYGWYYISADDKAPASVIERLQESGVDVTVVPVGRRE